MKNLNYITTSLFLLIATVCSAQTSTHLWQLPSEEPQIIFNQKGEMGVFTYDRFSVYDIKSGKQEKSYDLLANRSPYIWPNTNLNEYSDDFRYLHFYGKDKDVTSYRGKYVRFDAEEKNWEVPQMYDASFIGHTGMDIQGREVVKNTSKKVTYLTKLNGKKIKKIADVPYVGVMAGGRYGVYTKDGQGYLIDFRTDATTPLPVKGNASPNNAFKEWIMIKDGNTVTLFNPYTNQQEAKAKTDARPEVPSKYFASLGKFQFATYYGDFIYQVVKNTSEPVTSDANGAVPFVVNQYKAADGEFVKSFQISSSATENTAKLTSVSAIYDGVKLIESKSKALKKASEDSDAASAKKFADRQEAKELAKELFINFKKVQGSFGFSLLSLEGRDITNLPYTKKYLSHLKGTVNAVARFNVGTSTILIVALQNGNDLSVKFLNLHYEGAYWSTKHIATVTNYGNLITHNLSIGFTQSGSRIRADVVITYQATGKKVESTVYSN